MIPPIVTSMVSKHDQSRVFVHSISHFKEIVINRVSDELPSFSCNTNHLFVLSVVNSRNVRGQQLWLLLCTDPRREGSEIEGIFKSVLEGALGVDVEAIEEMPQFGVVDSSATKSVGGPSLIMKSLKNSVKHHWVKTHRFNVPRHS